MSWHYIAAGKVSQVPPRKHMRREQLKYFNHLLLFLFSNNFGNRAEQKLPNSPKWFMN